MIICLAQVRSVSGDIEKNLEHHIDLLHSAQVHNANLVVFPELSLTNYDPEIVQESAIDLNDQRLGKLQAFADKANIIVAVGVPLRGVEKPSISLAIFSRNNAPQNRSKIYLHPDELEYFSSSNNGIENILMQNRIGVAICYEISIKEHTKTLIEAGSSVYLASVAKTKNGMSNALTLLSATSKQYSIPSLLVNSVGTCEGKPSGGESFVLDSNGTIVAQLTETDEGYIIYDTTTGKATSHKLDFA
jgi:predicted amidohydrolase